MQEPHNAETQPRGPLAWIAIGIGVVLLLATLCYWPSLKGPFLFDDIPNLELLGERGVIDSFDKYVEFISSAQAGPLGRPLSLASFVLNGQTWPTDAFPFRVTNLIIHCVNGLLIFALAYLIFATMHKKTTAQRLALLCLALWILHPMLVSTTAYVIQRMTQLGALFTLTGLISYLCGRKMLVDMPRQGWTLIILGMGISGTLAVLCKETGVLLPLYALVIELTLFARLSLHRQQRMALITLFSVPLIAVLAYMVLNWGDIRQGFEFRPFTLTERLLTQATVLVEYLQQILAPQLSGLGYVHDDYPISRGLFNPIGTIISLFVLAGMFILAIALRTRWPFVSLGVLWFLVGNSLEAGPLALELYYEHRNYLPMVGPLIAVCSFLPLLSARFGRAPVAALVLIVCFEGFLTWQSAVLWGNEDLLMRTALVEHPDSLRAQQYPVNQYILGGRYAEALAAQETLAITFPDHTSTRLSILNLKCLLNELTPDEVQGTREFLEHSDHDVQIIGFLLPLVAVAQAAVCDAYGLTDVQNTLDAMLRNAVISKKPDARGALHYHKGLAYHKAGAVRRAIDHLDLSYDAVPEIGIRIQQVVWLLEAGDTSSAQRHLALARQHGDRRPGQSGVRETDIEILQQRIDRAVRQN